MTPNTQKRLAEHFRERAREEADNAVDETCEVRLDIQERPVGDPDLRGAWVHLWRFIKPSHLESGIYYDSLQANEKPKAKSKKD
jgi:hypothetical protein